MKIDDKSLSLPPYISTTWQNVSSLYMKGNLLVIVLLEGDVINIPGLEPEVIQAIFTAHASFIEKNSTSTPSYGSNPKAETELSKLSSAFSQSLGADQSQELPFRIGFGNMEGISNAMQHNPAQANMPNLPEEILSKIGAIAKVVVPEENVTLPKPEPHCNCIHCQIAREILRTFGQTADHPAEISHDEEIIKDEELQFQQWEITQAGEKLFTVVSRLDNKEKYSVYLGHPVGCTCGKQGCEHIVAVLKS